MDYQRAHLVTPMVAGLNGGKMSSSDPGKRFILTLPLIT